MSAVNETLIRDIVREALGRLGDSHSSEMPGRWMPPSRRFLAPDGLRDKPIQLQRLSSGMPDWADAHNPHIIPPKVKSPGVSAGIKQTHVFASARINRSLAGTFAERARNARQVEVAKGRFPTCVKWNDVVDMESSFLPVLRDAAIFASVCGASNDLLSQQFRRHQSAKRGVHQLAGRAGESGKADRQVQRVLRLRASRMALNPSRGLVYLIMNGASSEALLEIGTWPDQQVIPSQIERAFAYPYVAVARN
jgi:hypothetical protein